MQVDEMRTRLEERIRRLENEKSVLLKEVAELSEIVGLSEKAKTLENEVNKLKDEAKILKDRIPREFLQELEEIVPSLLEESEEETSDDECSNCDEELL
jgi:hypothetical protein